MPGGRGSEAVMTTVVCAGGQHGELPVGGVAGGERWPNPLMLFTGTGRSHISASLDGCMQGYVGHP